MSWLDKIKRGMYITCGDGQIFHPQWLNAIKAKEYKASEFEFIDVAGTLAVRKSPKGRKYNIEIYFQGENHLDVADSFEESADDPRPWEISHPFYGDILVQPLNLSFDNKDLNVSKITGMVVETIKNVPIITVNPQDQIVVLKNKYDDLSVDILLVKLAKPKTATISRIRLNAQTCYNQGKKGLTNTLDAQAYTNAFNDANDLVNRFVSQPLAAARAIQTFINKPFQFVNTVKNRVDNLFAQFDLLAETITTLLTPQEKAVYEYNCGTIISAMAIAAVTEPDYISRNDVVGIIDSITDAYNQYLDNLDSLQTDTGGDPDSFMPDADGLIAMSNLINFTLANLFQVAISAKQERTIYTQEDSNLILLAHRYYGLLADDSTIQQMMDLNNIGLNEMLLIPKGRKITYLV